MATQTIPKQCPQCKQEFPATTEYFYKHPETKDGLRPLCKQCFLQISKQYYQTHTAKRRQSQKRYRQAHKVEDHKRGKQYYKTIQGYMRHVWYNMLSRCNNPKHQSFKHYGARGIKVKFAYFKDFYDYVVKELSADPRGLTIDRIDNYGHYEPGNIRFVSQAENNRNRRLCKKSK